MPLHHENSIDQDSRGCGRMLNTFHALGLLPQYSRLSELLNEVLHDCLNHKGLRRYNPTKFKVQKKAMFLQDTEKST